MAGDWIKFETATLDKPEVLQMADLLEVSADDVVGKLLRVWAWFDKNSTDGYAGGVTGASLMFFIDRLVSRNGFAACMKKVGWLTDDGLPKFDRHNGESSKKRALSKDRMQRKRYAESVTTASPEKRREEKKTTTSASAFVLPDWVPKDAWDAFVEARSKSRAALTDRAKALAVTELTKLKGQGHDPAAVLNSSVLNGYRGLFPPKGVQAKPANWRDDPTFAGMV